MELGGIILAVVITLIAVATFVSVAMLRNRRRVWERFARRHGLHYRADTTSIDVTGNIQGRRFRLFTPQVSSDSGTLGVQDVRMELGLHGNLPADTLISKVGGWVGAIDRASEAEAVTSGDEAFDRSVLIESASKDSALTYLTPDRRALISELLTDAHADDGGIDGDVLFVQDREMLTDLDRIEQRLAIMLRLAPGLDASTPTTSAKGEA
jgi:hypothetical protein